MPFVNLGHYSAVVIARRRSQYGSFNCFNRTVNHVNNVHSSVDAFCLAQRALDTPVANNLLLLGIVYSLRIIFLQPLASRSRVALVAEISTRIRRARVLLNSFEFKVNIILPLSMITLRGEREYAWNFTFIRQVEYTREAARRAGD